MTVHAVPHIDGDRFKEELSRIKPSKETKHNVMMLHAGVAGFDQFRMNEFGEQLVETCYIESGMDYIAMGHYHGHKDVNDIATYAGSTERLSFNEVWQDKGFVEVDLSTNSRRFIPLPVRPMIDVGPIDALRMSAQEVMDEILSAMPDDVAGKIVRLTVKDVQPPVYDALDHKRIRSLGDDAMHFEPRVTTTRDRVSVDQGDSVPISLEQEYVSFLANYPLETSSKDAVRERGLDHLRRGMAE